MTPQETFEYKQRWKPGFIVHVHSDNTDAAKTWCRRVCERHQWSMTEWTNPYEHTFHFEYQEHMEVFKGDFEFIDIQGYPV